MNRILKSLIAAALTACMCVTTAGCGDKEESRKKADNSSVSDVSDNSISGGQAAEQEGSLAAESSDGGTAEAENTDSALYAYYDELAAEYEQYGESSFRELGYETEACMVNGKIVGDFNGKLIVYDMASKGTKVICENLNMRYFYSNYYLYVIDVYVNGTITKYDLDGNIVQTGNLSLLEEPFVTSPKYPQYFYISNDGTVFAIGEWRRALYMLLELSRKVQS